MKTHLDLGLHSKITFSLFSEKFYAKPGVKDACIALKDKYQLSPNVLLFCCWLSDQNYPCLTKMDIQNIAKKIDPWNNKIIAGLKTLRDSIPKKHLDDTFSKPHAMILENELFAEKIERTLIVQAIGNMRRQKSPKENTINRALNSIFSYIKEQQIQLHKIDLEKIYRIVNDLGSA
jgi:uncharacterized protein (TIGR02444 family)